jgi:hypothetical protein
LLLDHVPPAILLLNVVFAPTHATALPVIAPGNGLTVIVCETEQPVVKVYDIVSTPSATPVTIPVEEPTVAIDKLLLDQAPKAVASVKLVVVLTQALLPDIGAGIGRTLTDAVTKQPVAEDVYVMLGVPELTPVTIPVAVITVANDVLLLLHVPAEASLKVSFELTQTLPAPIIDEGTGLTVKVDVTEHPGVP